MGENSKIIKGVNNQIILLIYLIKYNNRRILHNRPLKKLKEELENSYMTDAHIGIFFDLLKNFCYNIYRE